MKYIIRGHKFYYFNKILELRDYRNNLNFIIIDKLTNIQVEIDIAGTTAFKTLIRVSNQFPSKYFLI